MGKSLTSNKWAFLKKINQVDNEIILDISFEQLPADTLAEFQQQIFISAKLNIQNARNISSVVSTLKGLIDDTIDIDAVNEDTLQVNGEYEEIITIKCDSYQFFENPFSLDDWKNEYFALWKEMQNDREESYKDLSKKNALIEKIEHYLSKEKINAFTKMKYYTDQKLPVKVEIQIKQIDLIDHLFNFIKLSKE